MIIDKIKSFMRRLVRMLRPEQYKDIIQDNVSITQEMSDAITLWGNMMRGRAPWIGGENNVISLQIENSITREFANCVTNEMQCSVSVPEIDDIFQENIELINEHLQAGLGYGAMCAAASSPTEIQYFNASEFIPLSFSATKKLQSVAFLDTRKFGKTIFTRVEIHKFDKKAKTLTIENQAFRSESEMELGKRCELSVVGEWADLPEQVMYSGVEHPDFAYYRNPLANNIDDSPCGVSIFDAATELIKKADTQFGRLDWEFESGERTIHLDSRAIMPQRVAGVDGKMRLVEPNLKKRLYKGLNVTMKNDESLFKEYSPAMRETSFINGLNQYKRSIEFVVGLAYGDLSDPSTVEKTAEEIKAAKQRKYSMVSAIQNNLKSFLEDLAYVIAFYNAKTQSGYEVSCVFSDSIKMNEETEREQDRLDVAMGAMSLVEYRAKWYGEDIDTAQKAIDEINEPEEEEEEDPEINLLNSEKEEEKTTE